MPTTNENYGEFIKSLTKVYLGDFDKPVSNRQRERMAREVVEKFARRIRGFDGVHNVNEVAFDLEISETRVRQLGKEMEIGECIDGLISFTDEEVELMRNRRRPGWPKGKPRPAVA